MRSPFKKGSLYDSIHNYIKIYLPNQKNASVHTIRSYRKTLDMFLDFAKDRYKIPLMDITFEMLTSELFAEFLDYIERERKCSVTTRNHRCNAIRSFFKYVGERDITAVAAAAEVRKIPLKTPDEIKAVGYMSQTAIETLIKMPDVSSHKTLRSKILIKKSKIL